MKKKKDITARKQVKPISKKDEATHSPSGFKREGYVVTIEPSRPTLNKKNIAKLVASSKNS